MLPLATGLATVKASRRSGEAVDLGALGGTRTPNLLIRSQMLYPLSYERWRPASLRQAGWAPCLAERPAACRSRPGCSGGLAIGCRLGRNYPTTGPCILSPPPRGGPLPLLAALSRQWQAAVDAGHGREGISAARLALDGDQ
jgi:hypothetical protein